MSDEKLFVFGFGYSARVIVARMRSNIAEVFGTTRDPERLGEIDAAKVTAFLFDGTRHVSPLSVSPQQGGRDSASAPPLRGKDRESGRTILDALFEADLVLVSIPPDESGDPVLRHFRSTFAAAKPKSFVYLSTVGVYGDHGGAWVDETAECRPVSRRSKERLVAETDWQAFSRDAGVPLSIVRLGGIYGPGRGPFAKIRKGTARRIIKPGQVFNRIHVDDIAQIVEAAFSRRASGIFNGVDDEPARPEEVIAHAAKLLGRPPPPAVAYEKADLSPMARSFYGESKRVGNSKIRQELGVKLLYPTYREGLRAIAVVEGLFAPGESVPTENLPPSR